MPTVPIEENRVGLAAVTDAKLRPGDYTGTGLQAVGSGLATLGEALGGVSKDLQKKQQLVAAQRASDQAAADAALKQGYNAYDGAARGLLRAGGGYLTQFGQAAVEAADSVSAALGRIPDEIRKTMQPHVRDLFDGVIGQRVEQDIAGVRAHADAQKTVWQGQQAEQLMEASAANALDHIGTPLFVDHVATGLKALDDRAAVQGWDPAAKGAAELGYISGIHKRAIDGLTVGDAIAADAYYRAHENEMTAKDRAEIEQSLRQPLLERRAAAVIDSYGASVAGDSDGPAEPYAPRNADLPAIYAYLAEQDLPPEVEEAALNDAAARAAQNERRIAQDQRAARDTAFELTDRLGEGFTSITKLSPDVLRGLDPETRDALARQAGRNARPEPVEPHGKVAYDLTMLAATDRQAFVERDLRLDRDRMTPEDYDALNEAQQGWRSDPPAIGAVTQQRVVDAMTHWGAELGGGHEGPDLGRPNLAIVAPDGSNDAPMPQNAVFMADDGRPHVMDIADERPNTAQTRRDRAIAAHLSSPAPKESYVREEPASVAAFRKSHPAFAAKEKELFNHSLAWSMLPKRVFGKYMGAREHALLVYQDKAGHIEMVTYSATPEVPNHIDFGLPFGQLPQKKGYKLIIAEHTHPFPSNAFVGDTGVPGPTNGDISYVKGNPGTTFIIRSLFAGNLLLGRETVDYYFGNLR